MGCSLFPRGADPRPDDDHLGSWSGSLTSPRRLNTFLYRNRAWGVQFRVWGVPWHSGASWRTRKIPISCTRFRAEMRFGANALYYYRNIYSNIHRSTDTNISCLSTISTYLMWRIMERGSFNEAHHHLSKRHCVLVMC